MMCDSMHSNFCYTKLFITIRVSYLTRSHIIMQILKNILKILKTFFTASLDLFMYICCVAIYH